MNKMFGVFIWAVSQWKRSFLCQIAQLNNDIVACEIFVYHPLWVHQTLPSFSTITQYSWCLHSLTFLTMLSWKSPWTHTSETVAGIDRLTLASALTWLVHTRGLEIRFKNILRKIYQNNPSFGEVYQIGRKAHEGKMPLLLKVIYQQV